MSLVLKDCLAIPSQMLQVRILEMYISAIGVTAHVLIFLFSLNLIKLCSLVVPPRSAESV